MIKLQVIGNLGKDCIMKEVNGKNVINFSVAHTEKYKDAQGNQKEKTIWVECAYWTDRTAISPYLTKGTMVFAEGSPEVESYMNRDNQPAATLRLRISNVQLLGNRNNNNVVSPGSNTEANTNSFQQPMGGSMAVPVTAPMETSMAAPMATEDIKNDLPF